MIVQRKSILDGKIYEMDLPVTAEQLEELRAPGRRLVQDIFPDLDADRREFLISGITPEKWRETFGGDE